MRTQKGKTGKPKKKQKHEDFELKIRMKVNYEAENFTSKMISQIFFFYKLFLKQNFKLQRMSKAQSHPPPNFIHSVPKSTFVWC